MLIVDAADAGHDARDRQRQLDLAEDLELGHAHARGRRRRSARSTWRMPTKVLVRIGGMPRIARAMVRVSERRPRHRRDQSDQRQLRDRAAGVAERRWRPVRPCRGGRGRGRSAARHQRQRQRQERDLELGQRQFDHLVEAADLVAAGHVRGLRREDEFDRAAERGERRVGSASSRRSRPSPGRRQALDAEQDHVEDQRHQRSRSRRR